MRSSIGFVFCVVVGLLLCAVKIQAQKISGTPGVDYPDYFSIPQTSFKCSEQKYNPGFYADLETDCQVFHFCFDQRHESFLCPTGTTFNQPILSCDPWYNSNCSLAPLFYVVNAGPGIESAGKKIPLLLKLRDRAKDGFTPMASVSNIFEKISALNEESAQQETYEVSEEGTGTLTLDNVEREAKDVGNESEINSKMSEVKLENSFSDIQGDQSAGHLEVDERESLDNALDSSDENLGESQEEFNDESSLPDLIYDPVTDGYYMQTDYSSNSEWPSESEPNSQFQSFYDFGPYGDQMMQDVGESVQFQDTYEDESYTDEEGNEYSEVQNENSPGSLQFNKNDMNQRAYYDEMSEFSKRLLQTSQIPKRTRRKPTYIVVDQPDIRVPIRKRQSLYDILEPTQTPFDESISIDSVVEESSTEFMEFSADENEGFEIEESDQDLGETADEISRSDTSDFEKDYSEDSNWSSKVSSDSESDISEFSDEKAEDKSETSEAESDQFPESEDSSINIERDLTEKENLSDSTAGNENDSVNEIDVEEDITIYDDSDDPEIYDVSEQNVVSDVSVEEQDTLLVIPDETDFPTTSEDSAIESASFNGEYEYDRSNQNWQYVYSETGEVPQYSDSKDEDIEGNGQSTDEINSERTHYPSEYAAQSNYAYPGTYNGISYSQYQPSEYDFTGQKARNYIPESYYQYAPKEQRYFPEQEPYEVSYQAPEDGDSEANQDSSEFDPTNSFPRILNVPDGMYSYETSDGQSYGYYPQMQESGYMNDYPYSSQYSYPHGNIEDGMYSNEGDESEYVTESSDTGLPFAPEYEGLQETWAQTDFESENSEAIDDEANDSQQFKTEGGYTISYDEPSSEGSNEGFGIQDTGNSFSENFKDQMQNEETYYVLEDEDAVDPSDFNVQENSEEIEAESNETDKRAPMSSDSNFDHKDILSEKDILNKFEPLKADVPGVVYSNSESMLNVPNGKSKFEGVAMSEPGIKTDSSSFNKNSNPTLDSWSSHTLDSDQENEKPVTLSSTLERLAGMKPTKVPLASRDFMAPAEAQFINSMPFPNSMEFGPYGFGANMGQQFAMMDSSNLAPFSKIENRITPESVDSGMSRLSKLSSLQEKVRSMKRGKFGMFKRYMNSIKNQKE